MAHVFNHVRLTCALLLASAAMPSRAFADAAGDAKAQSDLADAELARLKTIQGMLAAPPGVAEGKATLTSFETGAEVLRLRHAVETNLATRLASGIPKSSEALILVFGSQPPTTAHYLSIRRGVIELKKNTAEAIEMGRVVFGKKPARPVRPQFSTQGVGQPKFESFGSGAGVALTAVSTLVSLLRVDTELKGAALASNADSLGPIVAQALTLRGWRVKAPSRIASATPYADGVIEDLRKPRDEAAKYYGVYLARLKAKGGKVEDLTEDERIAGTALATVVGNFSALVDGLFIPVNGVLPATVIEEEKELADAAKGKNILYVQAHEAALTSITKKGFLTGIIGIPAYVSASSVASFTFVGKEGIQFGSVSYQTPVLRVTDVASWAARQPDAMAGLADMSGSAETATGN